MHANKKTVIYFRDEPSALSAFSGSVKILVWSLATSVWGRASRRLGVDRPLLIRAACCNVPPRITVRRTGAGAVSAAVPSSRGAGIWKRCQMFHCVLQPVAGVGCRWATQMSSRSFGGFPLCDPRHVAADRMRPHFPPRGSSSLVHAARAGIWKRFQMFTAYCSEWAGVGLAGSSSRT
jgi:hypothetical protein